MVSNILKIPRFSKKIVLIVFDINAVIISLFLAFFLRLGHFYFPTENHALFIAIFAAPFLAFPFFMYFGLYREVIRYMGLKFIWRILQSVSTYSLLWGLITLMLNIQSIPRSVILINWLLLFTIICGSRLLIRWIFLESNIKTNLLNKTNVVIYGAGSAGRQLTTALRESSEYSPEAFIDDSNELRHQSIIGIDVYSPDELSDLVEQKNIKEVFVAIPSLSRSRRSEIINFLEPLPVTVRSLPSLSKLAQGKVKINDLLEIDLTDLLGRFSVKPNKDLLKVKITNKVVLVTGAGGSIGSELCRQILLLKPKKLILYDISESSLYLIEQELKNTDELNEEIYAVIGSVLSQERMENIFKYYGVQTVYHAAAYKHVPLVELNPSQGILNNAIGTMVAAEAAISENVETFVLISTDKAVRPTNIMGASKRVAELVLQAFAKQNHNTCFTMVRFGNVLDSSGSVIPLFKKQIKAGGPVTVTHPEVVRYFMTIPEAVELVIQAGAMAKGGEVFILDMGAPIRIYDLAVKMIKLSGLQLRDKNNLNGDIEIRYTGLRPGEKLYEELLLGGNFTATDNKLIMCAEEEMISWDILKPMINEVKEASSYWKTQEIYKALKKIVPEYKSTNKISNN